MAGFYVNFSCPEIKNAISNLKSYDTKTAMKIEQAVSSSTKTIGKEARTRIPVRTGKLKKSVRTNFNITKCEGTVKAKQYYAHFVEFGAKASGNIPKRNEQPYMRPSFEAEKPNLIRNIEEAVKR